MKVSEFREIFLGLYSKSRMRDLDLMVAFIDGKRDSISFGSITSVGLPTERVNALKFVCGTEPGFGSKNNGLTAAQMHTWLVGDVCEEYLSDELVFWKKFRASTGMSADGNYGIRRIVLDNVTSRFRIEVERQ